MKNRFEIAFNMIFYCSILLIGVVYFTVYLMLCLQIFGFDSVLERKDVLQFAPSIIALTALIFAVFQYNKNNKHNIDIHNFEEAKHLLIQIEKMSANVNTGADTNLYNISYYFLGLSNYYNNLKIVIQKITSDSIKDSIIERVMSFNIMKLQDITIKMQIEQLAIEKYIDEIAQINNEEQSLRYDLYLDALLSNKFYQTQCLHSDLARCIDLVLFVNYPSVERGQFFSEKFLKYNFPFIMAIRTYKS